MELEAPELKGLYTKEMFSGLYDQKEAVQKYTQGRVAFGRRVTDGSTYYIDCTECFRAVFIARTRDGKTFAIRAIKDRLKASGKYAVFVPTDVKDEFGSSNEPVQDKFKKLLLPKEKPTKDPTAVLRPTFFKKIDSTLPAGNFWVSPNPGLMEEVDFERMMDFSRLTKPQQDAMKEIYQKLRKGKMDYSEGNNVFMDMIDSMDYLKDEQIIGLKNKVRHMTESHFYEPKHEVDIVRLMKKGMTVTLNMKGFRKLSRGRTNYTDLTIAIMLRQVIDARTDGKIPRVFIIVDEAPRFIPINRESFVKSVFLESMDLDTRYWIGYLYAAQSFASVPVRVLDQCRYIFISGKTKPEIIKKGLEMVGLIKNQQRAKNTSLKWKRKIARHPYAWLVIDTQASDQEKAAQIVIPYGPLSKHAETGE